MPVACLVCGLPVGRKVERCLVCARRSSISQEEGKFLKNWYREKLIKQAAHELMLCMSKECSSIIVTAGSFFRSSSLLRDFAEEHVQQPCPAIYARGFTFNGCLFKCKHLSNEREVRVIMVRSGVTSERAWQY